MLPDLNRGLLNPSNAYFVFMNVIISLLIVFGGLIPYLFQCLDIIRSRNSHGFSLNVCLLLIVANVLRIHFWFDRHFEWQLLVQSVVMFVSMLMFVHFVVGINRKFVLLPQKSVTIWDGHLISHFWSWTDFASYLTVVFVFAIVVTWLTIIWVESAIFVEILGHISLFSEANIGMGQVFRNYQRKSTLGMSVKMVLLLLLGDLGKTIYFLLRMTPWQFWLAGCFQIAVDIILSQVHLYRSKSQRSQLL